jgi:hypothetical protein
MWTRCWLPKATGMSTGNRLFDGSLRADPVWVLRSLVSVLQTDPALVLDDRRDPSGA